MERSKTEKGHSGFNRRDVTKLFGAAAAAVGIGALLKPQDAFAGPGASLHVNVQAFGAQGDGVTDDQPAIQAALDSVATDGGTVVFPPGTYRVNSPLFIGAKVNDNAGFNVVGSGRHCVIQAGAGFPTNVALVYVLGGNGAISDIGLDGTNLAQNGIEFWVSTPDDRPTYVHRVGFGRFLSNGFICTGGEAYDIRDCFFGSLGGYAIYNHNNGVNSIIDGNYMLGCGGVYLGAQPGQGEGIRITNNTILASAGAGIGIYVDHVLELIIANNVIDQVANGSIRIRNGASYVKVLGNWLSATGPGTVVVEVSQFANSLFFGDNTFEGGSDQLSFISSASGDIHSVTVHNNIFNNTGNVAMNFQNVRRASIMGNHARGPGTQSLVWTGSLYGALVGNILWKAPVNGGGLSSSANLGW